MGEAGARMCSASPVVCYEKNTFAACIYHCDDARSDRARVRGGYHCLRRYLAVLLGIDRRSGGYA